jgi:hypothetical protein
MKGEVLDSQTTWRGNPAKLVRRQVAVPEGGFLGGAGHDVARSPIAAE